VSDRRAIRERLEREPIPGARETEERTWETVRAAYAERTPAPATARYGRFVGALAGAGVIAALVLSPAGADVRDWIGDAIDPGVRNAEPALTSLPTEGRLLVESAQGPWIVNEDGSKRLLGDYEQATWSPQGLFVAATKGHELTALVGDPEHAGQPIGTPRWSQAQERPVSHPAWAPSGFRVAYLAGAELHVIVGDGTNDRVIDRRVAEVAPVWQPMSATALERNPDGVGTHRLAYVDAGGTVRVVDTDSGRTISQGVPHVPRTVDLAELHWTPDGRWLVALGDHGISAARPPGKSTLSAELSVAPNHTAGTAVPGSDVVAVTNLYERDGRARSKVTLWPLRDDLRPADGVFAGPGRITQITSSPDGRWLLLASRDADQWIFIRIADGKLEPIDSITTQFDPGGTGNAAFPSIAGWCCTR
jgi:hypothetical protein